MNGSMSGYINGLIVMDKEDAKMVRDHIVKEGRDLGILPPIKAKDKFPDTPIIPQPTPVTEDICTGHDHFKRNCSRPGCKYA